MRMAESQRIARNQVQKGLHGSIGRQCQAMVANERPWIRLSAQTVSTASVVELYQDVDASTLRCGHTYDSNCKSALDSSAWCGETASDLPGRET